jgi:hypothetical protein
VATASKSDAVVDESILGPPSGDRNLQGVTADVYRRLTFDPGQPVRRKVSRALRAAPAKRR